jgi:hypothetical protein
MSDEQAQEQEPDARELPLELDSRHPYQQPFDARARRGIGDKPLSYAGGLEWSPAFKRYIGGVVPVTVAAERAEQNRQWYQWWTVPYVLERLKAHLETTPEDQDTVRAVVDWMEHPQLEPWRIARKYKKSARWLVKQKSRAKRLVRAWYLPYTHPRRHDQSLQREDAGRVSTRSVSTEKMT